MRGLVGILGLGAVLAALIFTWPGPALNPAPPQDRAIAPWGSPDGAQIVAFGTSLTAGNGWPDRLEARLSECLETPITLTRVAEAGRGSAWGLSQLEAVAALMPDLVLIEFAINDADLRDGVSRRTALDQHRRLVAGLRAALPEASLVLLTMSPAYGPRGVIRPRLSGHYADLGPLAEAEDLGLVDLYARWRAADVPRPTDGLHPDAAATAQVIDPALTAALAQAWAPGGAQGCWP